MRKRLNLNEILDKGEYLIETEFCKDTFKNGTIIVVGRVTPYRNVYVVKCSICAQDEELFGEGLFYSSKKNLERGFNPCGCSDRCRWSKEQFFIRCARKAHSIGLDFMGFGGKFKGHKTTVMLFCKKHGTFKGGTINSFMSPSVQECPKCRVKTEKAKRQIKEGLTEEDYIKKFMATGSYHEDTLFWKNYRVTRKGRRLYWSVFCPVCSVVGETSVTELLRGSLCCDCYNTNQKQAYINLVKDTDTVIAIKYGISTSAKARRNKLNRDTTLSVVLLSIHQFDTAESCQEAEKVCKRSLDSGVISKRDFKDGFSETTHVYNIDMITKIYEDHGGDLVYKLGFDGNVEYDVSVYSCSPRADTSKCRFYIDNGEKTNE